MRSCCPNVNRGCFKPPMDGCLCVGWMHGLHAARPRVVGFNLGVEYQRHPSDMRCGDVSLWGEAGLIFVLCCTTYIHQEDGVGGAVWFPRSILCAILGRRRLNVITSHWYIPLNVVDLRARRSSFSANQIIISGISPRDVVHAILTAVGHSSTQRGQIGNTACS